MRTRLLSVAYICLASGLVFAQDQAPLSVPPPPPTLLDQISQSPAEYTQQMNDYKSDWRQAGPAGLGDQLRSHVVRLDKTDALTGKLAVIKGQPGRLSPIQSVKIRFVQNGEVKAETTPGLDGTFRVKNLEEGVYSMIAAGSGGFLAWSVNVQPKNEDIARMPKLMRAKYLAQEVKDSLDVEAAAVPPANFVPLRQLLQQYLPSEDSTLYLDGNDIPEGMQEDPQDAAQGTQLKHHQVMLTSEGKLLGRIRRLQPNSGRDLKIRQLNVFLLQGDRIVDQEEVSPNGTFAFEDVQAGVFSLVAAGTDGFLAFSIDVVNQEEPATETASRNGVLPVKFAKAQAALQIDVALCSPMDFNQQNLNRLTDNFVPQNNEAIANAGPAPAPAAGMPAAGAPAGGGFGGGGSGFGGGGAGGGLGGVLLGGAIGAGIGAVINDDDGVRQQASPASPSGT